MNELTLVTLVLVVCIVGYLVFRNKDKILGKGTKRGGGSKDQQIK